MMYAGSHLY